MSISDNVRLRVAGTRLGSVEAELVQEKAASLRRIAERLDRALQALRALDAGEQGQGAAARRDAPERADLVAEAAEALWYYVVQREACGLRDSEELIRELQVPPEVRVRMGVRRTQR